MKEIFVLGVASGNWWSLLQLGIGLARVPE
jgi:hypothetical protein